jgi:hypothetical protein
MATVVAKVELKSVTVACAFRNDATTLSQVTRATLGVPRDRIRLIRGDTKRRAAAAACAELAVRAKRLGAVRPCHLNGAMSGCAAGMVTAEHISVAQPARGTAGLRVAHGQIPSIRVIHMATPAPYRKSVSAKRPNTPPAAINDALKALAR